MARFVDRVASPWPAARTLEYMADLRHFEEWDPGVKRAEQVVGDGPAPGAQYAVTVGGIGRDLTLYYEIVEYEPGRRVVALARTPRLRSEDIIAVEPDGERSVIVYDANLSLHGILRPLHPLLGLVFGRIAGRAAAGLRARLALEAR